MKVTSVSPRPSDAAKAAGRPELTAELLAAVGAKYSRSNEGLQGILGKIDQSNPDKSVEAIFRFVDYGHQSIADMVPVAMFIDGISVIMAYLIWAATPVQTAAGQESSTRYIRLSPEGLVDPDILGIDRRIREEWQASTEEAFKAYDAALKFWGSALENNPELARIPKAILDDPKASKQVERMKRNYAFDRSRYFLPVTAATNMFLEMSARSWVGLCQYLLSNPLKEARLLGEKIVEELKLHAPNMVRHAIKDESTRIGILSEWDDSMQRCGRSIGRISQNAYLEVMPHFQGLGGEQIASALQQHKNRYAWIGSDLRRLAVRFGWKAVAFAEIRDMNRHRTGTKHCPLVPMGFYSAENLVPTGMPKSIFNWLNAVGTAASSKMRTQAVSRDYTYVYWALLGTQFPFEHITTGDKAVYEWELRTGTGAHPVYAQHYREVLELWYTLYPETKGLVLEGSAEPE